MSFFGILSESVENIEYTDCLSLEYGAIGCPEKSVRNYQQVRPQKSTDPTCTAPHNLNIAKYEQSHNCAFTYSTTVLLRFS